MGITIKQETDVEQQILEEVQKIASQSTTKSQKFSLSSAICSNIANAPSFMIALTLNGAFQLTFQKFLKNSGRLWVVWLTALLVFVICILLCWLIWTFLYPFLDEFMH